jgi:transposase
MRVIYGNCAGLDVHKDSVLACARAQAVGTAIRREQRRFSTTTSGLLELLQWLSELQCTHVAMEATGVYWKPVWHVLEGHFELLLANPARIRNVPGRKSDVNDATWIADLLAHGLIAPSFVPPRPIQELRELTRTRRQLVREIGQHSQRIQRVLQDANFKLSSVLSDVLGQSGRRILDAIVAGEHDPIALAALGSKRLHCPKDQLAEALRGNSSPHIRFLLRQHLATIDHLRGVLEQFDAQIDQQLQPLRDAYERLQSIPGIGTTAAALLLGEIGDDMSRFPSAAHLRSWAGLCPRMDESAGKRRCTRVRSGAPWLKPVLIQCAWAAVRRKGTDLHALFVRLKIRRGPSKAIVAVAAAMLNAAYAILRDGTSYRDLGPEPLSRAQRIRSAERLTRRLRDLGYQVSLQQAAG